LPEECTAEACRDCGVKIVKRPLEVSIKLRLEFANIIEQLALGTVLVIEEREAVFSARVDEGAIDIGGPQGSFPASNADEPPPSVEERLTE
jgi:hypothetical protein